MFTASGEAGKTLPRLSCLAMLREDWEEFVRPAGGTLLFQHFAFVFLDVLRPKCSVTCGFLADGARHPAGQRCTRRGQRLPFGAGQSAMKRCIGVRRPDPGRCAHRSTGWTCSQYQHPARRVLHQHFQASELEFTGASGSQADLADGDLLRQAQGIGCAGAVRYDDFAAQIG